MPGYLPAKDLELSQWLANFITIAQANEPALGLTVSDLATLTGEQTQFASALVGINTAKLGVTAATKTKDAAHKTVTTNVRSIVKKIQTNKTVPVALKSQLGITVSANVRTNTPPVTLTTLVATAHAIGTNVLAWKKMGNKPNTQYVVYSKPITPSVSLDAETGWTMVGQTTRSRFDHKNVTPGQPLAYKIVAARAEQTSQPTAPVTVYTN